MRHILVITAMIVTGHAIAANAQNPPRTIKLADVAGTWDTRAATGPGDTAGIRSVVTHTANGKGWTLQFPNRDPIPERIVTIGGDSIVAEAGPYPSLLIAGQTVTVLRTVSHYNGDSMTGTWEAHYASGAVRRGTMDGTRRK